MDERLRRAVEYADHHRSIGLQRKILKEKLDADLTIGYNGGIFKINQQLICFTQFFIDRGRVDNVPMIDINGNPIVITDLKEFQKIILDRYFSATGYYLAGFEKLKSLKLKEILIDL
jgi:hypothetical protein